MSRSLSPRTSLVIPLALALLAGCNDTETTAPKFRPKVQLAQGDGGVWTVNSLADPGDGTCDDTNCTLREAMGAAASGNSIVFAGSLQGPVLLTGELFNGNKSMTIDGGGRIILDGQSNTRVMFVGSHPLGDFSFVTLKGLTLSNGWSAFSGGALRVDDASVTLDSVNVLNNSSEDRGGGISISSDAEAIIRNSRIAYNFALQNGGGIDNGGILTLINSTVDGNIANVSGGGITSRLTLTVVASTISNNEGVGAGGGIHLITGATATVTHSTISGNHAPDGAGVANYGGVVTLRSVTLTRNVATSGTGGHAGAGATYVANSIIAGNTGSFSRDCSSSMTSLGYNLHALCGFTAAGDVQVTLAQLFTEVLEQDLKDNGGPSKTHALIARGRAVDAGYCPGESADQRGFARPVDDPTMPNARDACDIGAYEAQGPQVAVADLMVSQAVDKNSVKQGELLTYTVRVQNLGPQAAPAVVVANVLSSGVTFVAARQNKGTITAPPKGETGTVTWNLGDMANQANEVAEIVVTVLVRGKTTITNNATVTGNVADPNTANNSAAITVTVAPGGSGKRG